MNAFIIRDVFNHSACARSCVAYRYVESQIPHNYVQEECVKFYKSRTKRCERTEEGERTSD